MLHNVMLFANTRPDSITDVERRGKAPADGWISGDGRRSPEVGFQEWVSNHRVRLPHRDNPSAAHSLIFLTNCNCDLTPSFLKIVFICARTVLIDAPRRLATETRFHPS